MPLNPKRPSEYYQQNVWIGSSFITPREVAMRYEVGVDKIMWGNDYPHREATYPYTRECLRHSFSDVDPVEVAAMLGGNAAKVYGFDMDLMRKVAVESRRRPWPRCRCRSTRSPTTPPRARSRKAPRHGRGRVAFA